MMGTDLVKGGDGNKGSGMMAGNPTKPPGHSTKTKPPKHIKCMPVYGRALECAFGLCFSLFLLRLWTIWARKRKRKNCRRLIRRRSSATPAWIPPIVMFSTSSELWSALAIFYWIGYLLTSYVFLTTATAHDWIKFTVSGYGVGYGINGCFLWSRFAAMNTTGVRRSRFRLPLFVAGVIFTPIASIITGLSYTTLLKEDQSGCPVPWVPWEVNVMFALLQSITNALAVSLFLRVFLHASRTHPTSTSRPTLPQPVSLVGTARSAIDAMNTNVLRTITAAVIAFQRGRQLSSSRTTKSVIRRNLTSATLTGVSTVIFMIIMAASTASNSHFIVRNIAWPLGPLDTLVNALSVSVAFGDLERLWEIAKKMWGTASSSIQSLPSAVLGIGASTITPRSAVSAPYISDRPVLLQPGLPASPQYPVLMNSSLSCSSLSNKSAGYVIRKGGGGRPLEKSLMFSSVSSRSHSFLEHEEGNAPFSQSLVVRDARPGLMTLSPAIEED